MKLSTLFTISAVVFAVWGLPALFAPEAYLGFSFRETAGETGIWVARFGAAPALGLAVLAWYARKVEESRARQAIVRGLFVAFVISFILSLVGLLAGMLSAFGWSGVVVNLLLAVGCGYFWFVKPGAS